MSNEDLRNAPLDEKKRMQMRGAVVGDISCDIEVRLFLSLLLLQHLPFSSEQGGLEFLTHSTTLCDPSFRFKVAPSTWGAAHKEVTMMAVDILPTALPLDASKTFSESFGPYLKRALGWYGVKGLESANSGEGGESGEMLDEAMRRATIARGGELINGHRWLEEGVEAWRKEVRGVSVASTSTEGGSAVSSVADAPPLTGAATSSKETMGGRKKKVLMLGSGMVAGPAVEILAGRKDDVSLLIGGSLPFILSSRSSSLCLSLSYELDGGGTGSD